MADKVIDKQIEEVKDAVSNLTSKVHELDKNILEHKIFLESHSDTQKAMCQELRRMNDILQQNTNSLIEHMHRTGLLESAVDVIDKRIVPIEAERLKNKAVKSWIVDQLKFMAKIFGAVSAVFGAYVAVSKFFNF